MNLRPYLVLVASLVGCGPPSDTVIVEICGDVLVPTDIDAVRVSILAADRSEHRAGTLDLLNCGNEKLTLPQTSELGAPIGDIWVVAQGLQDGVEVVHSERRLNIEESGRAQDAVVSLTRSCMRVTCSLGQTCVNGTCKQAPWGDEDVACSGGAPSAGAGGGTAICDAGMP